MYNNILSVSDQINQFIIHDLIQGIWNEWRNVSITWYLNTFSSKLSILPGAGPPPVLDDKDMHSLSFFFMDIFRSDHFFYFNEQLWLLILKWSIINKIIVTTIEHENIKWGFNDRPYVPWKVLCSGINVINIFSLEIE